MTQNIPLPIILLPLPWKYLIGRFDDMLTAFIIKATQQQQQHNQQNNQSTKQLNNKTTKQQNNKQ